MVSTRSCTPGLDVRGGDDGGRAADRAGGVHPEQRLADGTERLGQVRLGHHHALEEVGRLADDDGVDVVHRQVGVRERAVGGLAQEARQGDVAAHRGVLGLADADDGHSIGTHQLTLQHGDEVLLQQLAAGGVGHPAAGGAVR